MRKAVLAIVVALATVMASLLLATDQASSPSADAPRVHSRKGVPLTQLGRGDEKELVVEKDASPPLSVEAPRGTGELEWLASLSQVVLKLRIERIESALTEHNDWITSTVAAEVLEVLKNSTTP